MSRVLQSRLGALPQEAGGNRPLHTVWWVNSPSIPRLEGICKEAFPSRALHFCLVTGILADSRFPPDIAFVPAGPDCVSHLENLRGSFPHAARVVLVKDSAETDEWIVAGADETLVLRAPAEEAAIQSQDIRILRTAVARAQARRVLPNSGEAPRGIPECPLEFALGALPESGLLLDGAGTILFANHQVETLVGVAPGNLAGRPSRELFPAPLDRSFHRTLESLSVRGPGARREWSGAIRSEDGRFSPAGVSLHVLPANSPARYLLWIRDHSAMDSLLDELTSSELGMRYVVEHSPMAVGVERSGQLVYRNARLDDILGLTGGITAEQEVAQFAPPDSRLAVLDAFRRARPADSDTDWQEEQWNRADGETFKARVIRLRAPFRGAPAVYFFLEDADLAEQGVRTRAHKDRLATIGAISASITHELNNALGFMLSNLQMMALDLDSPQGMPREDLHHLLDETISGARRSQRVIADLAVFAGEDREQPLSVDVRVCIRQALESTQSDTRPRAEIRAALPDSVSARIPRERLHQIMVNLILNAVESFPDGDAQDHWVEISAYTRGDKSIIEVQDNGRGISDEALENMTGAPKSTKARPGGTGFGLTACRIIIERFGGQLSITRRPHGGTCARITMPGADHPPAAFTVE